MQRVGTWGAVASIVGIMLAPAIVSAASDSDSTTIEATVDSVISMSTSGTVTISLLPTSSGALSSSSDTVTVSTNHSGGYTLTLKDADANTSLVSGGNSFTAHTGTPGDPTALTNGSWGFAVAGGNFDPSYDAETNNSSSTSTWAGIPASSGSAAELKSTTSTATNDATTVWYAVKADTSQAAGTYTDSVTYTATTN